MDLPNIAGYTLKNLNKINIVLGKNGCGKSIMLRKLEQHLASSIQDIGKCIYISPERGGTLHYTGRIDETLARDINYLSDQRRKNQCEFFKQQSATQYRKLQYLVLKEISVNTAMRADHSYTFDVYVEKINSVLENIELRDHDPVFKIYKRGTGEELAPEVISSGESELISLIIECLIFDKECIANKDNVLFLDEPDLHLHPDLQRKLMLFLNELVSNGNFRVLIATHSTGLLGGLEPYTDTHITFMASEQKEMHFKPVTEILKKIVPIFGAHPLSNIFNEKPILLVEGEDEERIWQQAVRSSEGKIKRYPCAVGGLGMMNKYEQEVQSIMGAVYENAKAFS